MRMNFRWWICDDNNRVNIEYTPEQRAYTSEIIRALYTKIIHTHTHRSFTDTDAMEYSESENKAA